MSGQGVIFWEALPIILTWVYDGLHTTTWAKENPNGRQEQEASKLSNHLHRGLCEAGECPTSEKARPPKAGIGNQASKRGPQEVASPAPADLG